MSRGLLALAIGVEGRDLVGAAQLSIEPAGEAGEAKLAKLVGVLGDETMLALDGGRLLALDGGGAEVMLALDGGGAELAGADDTGSA